MRKIDQLILLFLVIFIVSGCSELGSTYTVNFDSRGGSEMTPVTVQDGEIIDKPIPTKEGYTFEGWYTSLDGGETLSDKWVFTINPVTRDLTLYAKWDVNEYNLKAYDYYGLEIFNENLEFNTNLESIIESIYTEREGLTFQGWDITVPETMPAEDLVLNGQYTLNTYSIIFVDYDGEVLQTHQYEFRDSLSDLSFPQDPTREGHTFDSWTSDFGLTDILSRSMPSHDVIIQAEYSRIVTIEELVTNPDLYVGFEITVTGTITRKIGRHGFIQEGDFGVYVYTGFEYTTKFQIGNTVILHDVVPTYYPDKDTGMLQLSGFRARNLETIPSTDDIAPNFITISELTDNMIGSLVEIHNLTIIEVYPGMDGAFTVHTEDEYGSMIILRKDSSSSEDIMVADYSVGQVLNIIGPVHVINSDKVVMITNNNDVTFID